MSTEHTVITKEGVDLLVVEQSDLFSMLIAGDIPMKIMGGFTADELADVGKRMIHIASYSVEDPVRFLKDLAYEINDLAYETKEHQ